MNCVFKRLDISHLVSNGVSICWSLSPSFFPKGPLTFYVDFGWPGTDEWTVLNADNPVIDSCCYIDTCQRNWKTLNEAYYRVRLVLTGESGCPVYTSAPASVLSGLDRRDWLRARDIIRREYLQQRKVDGTSGILLKRKKFGVACPTCLDWDTGEVTNSDCPTCYGTGIVGGYYPGLVFYFTDIGNWPRKVNAATPPRGTNEDIVDEGNRCILYPLIDTRDVWVQANSNARYVIDSYTVAAAYKGVPLIGMAKLSLAPESDIIYTVPLEGQSSSSSVSGDDNCGATKGLPAEPGFDW